MGAASCDLPTIVVSGGPMLNGKFRNEDIGSGTNVWSMSEDVRAGKMSLADFMDAEASMSRSAGHCMTMGTASTMASMVEALGMGLPTNAAIPAADSRRYVLAHMAGRRAVEMVREDLRMSKVLTRKAFENAIRINGAIGGSTNAVVHLLALAGRIGVKLALEDFDRLGHDIPLLVNLMPSGQFLMEDFYYAGGLPAVIRELGDLIHRDALTVNGRTMGDNTAEAPCWNREVIATLKSPLKPNAGIAVLRGNLAPDGAVIKPAAAERHLWQHTGPAVVFADYNDMAKRIDDPALPVTKDSVLVLKHAGPQGAPGMPEWGQLPIPKKLLKKGVRDMLRISDARMSGTSYGACVLHVAPESFVGGPLALVQDGDLVELDVPARKLVLHVGDDELARRRAAWKKPPPRYERGFGALYQQHVKQADQGCDFDFLEGTAPTPEPEIH